MRIVISHPGKQHVYSLVKVLSRTDDLFFCSTIVFNNKRLLESKIIPGVIRIFFKKRYLGVNNIHLKRLWIDEVLFYIKSKVASAGRQPFLRLEAWQAFDRAVAKQIRQLNPDVFIGYETSSLQSFKKAKENGAVTILDLAYVHYTMNLCVQQDYPAFAKTFHNSDFYKGENELKEMELVNVDYILCLSSLAERSLLVAGIPASKIYKYTLGVNLELFKIKSALHQNHGGKIKLIYVGGITPRKGLDILFDICVQMVDLIELILVGPILDKDLIEKFRTTPNVVYKGYLNHEDLISEYHAADVFVFPSYLDSWGQVVLEAMACGLPVIVSDNTGAKDAVEKGGGLIVPTGNVDALKNAILFFLNNKTQIVSLGKKARETAEMYSLNNYALEINHIVEEIIKKQNI